MLFVGAQNKNTASVACGLSEGLQCLQELKGNDSLLLIKKFKLRKGWLHDAHVIWIKGDELTGFINQNKTVGIFLALRGRGRCLHFCSEMGAQNLRSSSTEK